MPPFKVQPTPNPNSLKFAATGALFITEGLAAYRNAAEAAADPLGAALFGVEGVADVLILPAFVTVTKRSDADWNGVLPAVERVLREHPGA